MLKLTWIDHENFMNLSTTAKALFLEFLRQYNGKNNGDLCVAWALMKKRGWKAKATVDRTVSELLAKGWIVKTRTGGRNSPNLYAVTVYGIDECNRKLFDPHIKPDPVPLNTWKINFPSLKTSQGSAQNEPNSVCVNT